MIEKIDHIGIVVKDLEKAIKVYSDVLGLKVDRVERVGGVQSENCLFTCWRGIG